MSNAAEKTTQKTSLNAADYPSVWVAVQEKLRAHMTEPSFETWISPLQFDSIDDKTVTLSTESNFKRDWILNHYRKELCNAFASVANLGACKLNVCVKEPAPIPVDVSAAQYETQAGIVHPQAPVPPNHSTEDTHQQQVIVPQQPVAASTNYAPNPIPSNTQPWSPRLTVNNLNPKYTFENLVVGQHNQFCHAAALAVSETPGQSYNPFYIHGGVGLGKTHLIQAIGHYISAHNPERKVRYVTSEQFTNELITTMQRKEWSQFRNRYRKIDVLIIDDVQFLGGKERTQQELFHTFNALHEAGKQIILSSDRSPKHLADLEDRLRSRFEWGLITEIESPDVETRHAILQRKAERENLNVPNDVLQYVAEVHPHNVRELEGALNKVAAYAMLTKTTLNLQTAQQVLGLQSDPGRISLDSIVDEVAKYYHMGARDLKSSSRAKDIAYARQVAIYMVRTMTETSYPRIGQLFGGRKHTTVLYSYEKIVKELEQHPVLSQQIRELTARIKSR